VLPAALLAVAMLVNSPVVHAAGRGSVAAKKLPDPQAARDYGDATLAKVTPGRTSKAEVLALLGKPWRETVLDEEDVMYPGDPAVEVWEYRGHDANGTYRVHIEFDKTGATSLVARIPDRTARAVARVARTTGDRDE
jgi:outer membrane protein assembly factor BamE (lipoprotein component of BamABCDE complex)